MNIVVDDLFTGLLCRMVLMASRLIERISSSPLASLTYLPSGLEVQ